MRKRICLIRLIRLILHKYWDIKMLNTHCDVLLETSLNGSWKPRRQTLRRCYARHVETWHEIGQASNVLTCLEDMSWIWICVNLLISLILLVIWNLFDLICAWLMTSSFSYACQACHLWTYHCGKKYGCPWSFWRVTFMQLLGIGRWWQSFQEAT